jgi:hypothetical protein
MNRRACALLGLVLIGGPVADRSAYAQSTAPSEAVRTEARERFDRGLGLFNAGDNQGALVEFRRAYELVENVVVLFNIGLVYAQTGRAVEATEALDRVLANPGKLSSERLALARKTRDEQAARIASVSVVANVDGGRVEVDGLEAGAIPLGAALRVTSGTHVVAVVAPGYLPQRKEIAIAGGEKRSVAFELVPMQGRLAHLVIKTHVPGADVFADDERIGSTPLVASVSLAPGVHRIDLRRVGYVSASGTVTLSDGATGEIVLEPTEDWSAFATSGTALALDVTETAPVVTIDGRSRGVYSGPLKLAVGPHHVLVERGDFMAAERDVTLDPGRTTTLHFALEPTPEYRARYTQRAQSQRMWGWIGVIGGAAVVGGGVGLVAYDADQRKNGNATANQLNAAIQPHSGSSCDPMTQDSGTLQYRSQCIDPLNTAYGRVSDANTRDYVGWGAVGLGAAGMVTGAILLLTADNPSRYDHAEPGPASGRHISPSIWTARDGGGISVVGAF